MSSLPARRASSSEEETHPAIDERKRKRMLSNRESARRSRMRKQQRLDELVSEEAKIKTQSAQLSSQIHAVTQRYAKVESENAILRAQLDELTQRLQSVNSVLRFVEEFSGMAMDIPEMPAHPILKPWQLPLSSSEGFGFLDTLAFTILKLWHQLAEKLQPASAHTCLPSSRHMSRFVGLGLAVLNLDGVISSLTHLIFLRSLLLSDDYVISFSVSSSLASVIFSTFTLLRRDLLVVALGCEAGVTSTCPAALVFRTATLPYRSGLPLCRPALVFCSTDLVFRSADLVFRSADLVFHSADLVFRSALYKNQLLLTA
ncbi:hypothetical protein ZIOFF_000655 [Zingiber officinale]|uniref:BZIP domain-containing protein n=1 Tax=Zingiber officinale TaxID=94328 RepID=A0A8J5HXM4_ZINOF|nr:hypothetical protein ZIOFF_000655 [Zingiber officinale]